MRRAAKRQVRAATKSKTQDSTVLQNTKQSWFSCSLVSTFDLSMPCATASLRTHCGKRIPRGRQLTSASTSRLRPEGGPSLTGIGVLMYRALHSRVGTWAGSAPFSCYFDRWYRHWYRCWHWCTSHLLLAPSLMLPWHLCWCCCQYCCTSLPSLVLFEGQGT